LSPCCEILDNSELGPNCVTAPFSVWSGRPAVQIGKLPDTYATLWQDHTRTFYRCFQPTPNTSTVAPTRVITQETSSTAGIATPASASTAAGISTPARPGLNTSTSTGGGITSPGLASPLASTGARGVLSPAGALLPGGGNRSIQLALALGARGAGAAAVPGARVNTSATTTTTTSADPLPALPPIPDKP
jgi:hypothetical protein